MSDPEDKHDGELSRSDSSDTARSEGLPEESSLVERPDEEVGADSLSEGASEGNSGRSDADQELVEQTVGDEEAVSESDENAESSEVPEAGDPGQEVDAESVGSSQVGVESGSTRRKKSGPRGPIEEVVEEDDEELDWYILKVQSNRENTVRDALQRRVAVAGLEQYFGEILVPTEDVAEFKNGKKRVVKHKLYPGYIVVNMVINDDTWFVVRETPGIGDFTGSAGSPSKMLPHEVERIVKSSSPKEDSHEPIKTTIPFDAGDRVRIKEGTFENFEGNVEGIDEANGRVTVTINIFGRSTPVELEHWQIESV